MALYPLKFQPIFKYRIWGGDKLKTVLNKSYDGEHIGESWEISDVEGDETIVNSGNLKGKTLKELIKTFKGDFLGEKVYQQFGDAFPLLIKFIDAKTPLSIQVHPSNEVAKQRHNSFGKNEMWYIMPSDKDAEIIVGFENDTDKVVYESHLENNSVLELMHHEMVQKGDTYYIPTGRIHAIGAGVMLAEIQQTSDITYRVFDYDRVDSTTGKKRDLHNDLALDVIDFKSQSNYKTEYKTDDNKANTLVHSPYFKTNFLPVTTFIEKDFTNLDSFVIYMCVSGEAEISYKKETYTLALGETILIPSALKKIKIEAKQAELLEVYM
jgi:mannose-6-phosphate isomerase